LRNWAQHCKSKMPRLDSVFLRGTKLSNSCRSFRKRSICKKQVTSRRQSYEGDYTATPEEHENRAEVAHILEEDEIKQSYRDAIASPIISLRGHSRMFQFAQLRGAEERPIGDIPTWRAGRFAGSARDQPIDCRKRFDKRSAGSPELQDWPPRRTRHGM
jgi:hypothetical protein